MIAKLGHYIVRGITRQRLRSAFTVAGIATAMFLFVFIEGLQTGVHQATEGEATKNILIVYQQNRFCPATSSLPERYASQIEKIPGVRSVLPVKVFVNNCRAALDSVTFRGVPPDKIVSGEKDIRLLSGSVEDFARHTDGALVGRRLAERRGLDLGEKFQIADVTIGVAGIFDSDLPGEDNLAYTQLEFLQRSRTVNSLGRVTQFEVTIDDHRKAEAITAQIDDMFRHEQVATHTKSHKAYVNAATGDLLHLVRFTRYLGFVCVLVVLALTANTVFVMVKDRVQEHAVLQTLGFSSAMLFVMVVAESLLLSLAGGVAGTLMATALLGWGHFGLGAEGVNISFVLAPGVVIAGIAVSALCGIAAGLVPAVIAARAPIVDSLRRA